ncbi:MAG: Mib herc2, partial [Candidatus Parcubacteria bacterium]
MNGYDAPAARSKKEKRTHREKPYTLATVAMVDDRDVTLPLWKRLSTPGTKVRIRKDSKYFGEATGIGTVVGPSKRPGWSDVRFNDGYRNGYRTGRKDGRGKVDLEPVRQGKGATAILALNNRVLGLPIPSDLSLQAGDTVKVDDRDLRICGIAKTH